MIGYRSMPTRTGNRQDTGLRPANVGAANPGTTVAAESLRRGSAVERGSVAVRWIAPTWTREADEV